MPEESIEFPAQTPPQPAIAIEASQSLKEKPELSADGATALLIELNTIKGRKEELGKDNTRDKKDVEEDTQFLQEEEFRTLLRSQGKSDEDIETYLEEKKKEWEDGDETEDDTRIHLYFDLLKQPHKREATEDGSAKKDAYKALNDYIEERIKEITGENIASPLNGENETLTPEEALQQPLDKLENIAKTPEGKKKVKKLIEELRAAIPAMGDYVVKNATIDSFINFVLTGESHSYGTSVFEMEKRGQVFIDEDTLSEMPFYNNPDTCKEYVENTMLHLDVLDEETKTKIRATRPPLDPEKIPPEFLSEKEGEDKKIDKEKYTKWLKEKFTDIFMQQREAMQKQMKKELFAKGVRKGKKLDKGEATQVEYQKIEEFDEKVEISSEFIRKLLSLI